MSRDSSGNYTLPAGNPVVGGTFIEPTWANPTLNDIALALTESVNIQGTKAMTGPLRLPDGNLAAPALGFNSNSDCGLFYSADSLQETINGVVESVLSAKGLLLTSSFGCADPLDSINKIINGDMAIAQRGTSQTTATYGSLDRWKNNFTGGAQTLSQQIFPEGSVSVPGYPQNYMRVVVTGGSGIADSSTVYQNIENVRTFANGKATLSFWAKADAPKNIFINLYQSFGTGGSTPVTSAGQTINLTTQFQRFTVTFDVPAITPGATITSDSYLGLYFWFSSGSSYSGQNNGLPVQNGTFDITFVQLQAGELASAYERESQAVSLTRCRRYYEKSYAIATIPGTLTLSSSYVCSCIAPAGVSTTVANIRFMVTKRSNPVVTIYNTTVANNQIYNFTRSLSYTSTSAQNLYPESFTPTGSAPAGSVAGDTVTLHWTADSEFTN